MSIHEDSKDKVDFSSNGQNNSPKIGHNKKTLLSNPVEHIDIKSFDARKIIDGMSKMSFTSEIQLERWYL